MARQRLGQHFLANAGWQERIMKTLPLAPDDTWIDIGAGHGEMTRLLTGHQRRVFAIETDAQLARALREETLAHPAQWLGVEIVPGDVLTLDLAKLAGGRFRAYGNLPYYITSPILHHLFGCADQIASAHLVIQMEVAARIVARPGRREYGYLSAACQFYAKPAMTLRLPPGAFRPPPRVTSALVEMVLPGERATLGISDETRFLDFLRLCFRQKRKTLRNNLHSFCSDQRIHEALAQYGLVSNARAEQLGLPQFAGLFSQLA
jgi:16S rRNA (adenine1518-N6/adenine1519-N6)-dimethyltransferase